VHEKTIKGEVFGAAGVGGGEKMILGHQEPCLNLRRRKGGPIPAEGYQSRTSTKAREFGESIVPSWESGLLDRLCFGGGEWPVGALLEEEEGNRGVGNLVELAFACSTNGLEVSSIVDGRTKKHRDARVKGATKQRR